MNRHERSRLAEEYFNEAAEALGQWPYRLQPGSLQRCIEHMAGRMANKVKADVEKIIKGL